MCSNPNIHFGVNGFESPPFFPSQIIFQASKQGVPSITSKPANTKMPSDACIETSYKVSPENTVISRLP